MRELIIGGSLILFGVYLVWQHLVFEWQQSLEKFETERAKFMKYMKKLGIWDGESVLNQYTNTDELRRANMRLKNCVK